MNFKFEPYYLVGIFVAIWILFELVSGLYVLYRQEPCSKRRVKKCRADFSRVLNCPKACYGCPLAKNEEITITKIEVSREELKKFEPFFRDAVMETFDENDFLETKPGSYYLIEDKNGQSGRSIKSEFKDGLFYFTNVPTKSPAKE